MPSTPRRHSTRIPRSRESRGRRLPAAVRRVTLLLIGILGLGFVLFRMSMRPRPWSSSEAGSGRPNIVIVSLDTTRPDRLAGAGGGPVATPGLDRVRGNGFLFTEACAPAPVTLPSHASLFTGRNPYAHGVRENTEYALADAEVTLAETYRTAGYETAAFVSSFVLDARFGLAQGFNVYEDRLDGPEVGLGPGTVELPGAVTVSRAARWLAGRASAKAEPFFLFVHFFDAHAPYRAPAPFAGSHPNEPYHDELAYQDRCLGQLLDAIESNGLADDTWIWVVSDHGESLGEHGESSHSLFVYDATLRVVSVLHPPARNGRYRSGRPRLTISQQTGLVDVYPTLLELSGLPATGSPADGRSLVPLLAGETPTEPPLYCETLSPRVSYHWSALFGIRTSDWKYVRAPIPELYDLRADPRELQNLAAARPTEVQRFEAELDRFLGKAETRDAHRRPSPEEEERLRSLGYVSGSAAATDDRALPDPKRMVAFFNNQLQQAKNWIYAGRYEEAIGALQEALRVDPLNNSLHLYLAGALRQAGRPDEACRAYRQAIRIEPHSPRAFFGLGQAHLAAERPDSAAIAFREALRLLPHAPDSWSALGDAEARSGRWREAAAAYDSALANGADPSRTHGLLARLYLEPLRDRERARGHLLDFARQAGIDSSAARARLPELPGAGR